MLTKELLTKMNNKMPTVDIKGKNYIMVNERIKRFREYMPGGKIETTIISLDNGIATIKASVYDDEDNLIATGHAQEKETSSFINKTSYIENCETSAIGRALGIAGIGIDDSLGSADEVANAINNQKKSEPLASEKDRKTFMSKCEQLEVAPTEILGRVGWTGGKMTTEHFAKAMIILSEIEEAK